MNSVLQIKLKQILSKPQMFCLEYCGIVTTVMFIYQPEQKGPPWLPEQNYTVIKQDTIQFSYKIWKYLMSMHPHSRTYMPYMMHIIQISFDGFIPWVDKEPTSSKLQCIHSAVIALIFLLFIIMQSSNSHYINNHANLLDILQIM